MKNLRNKLKLDKISEASSPDKNMKQLVSPLKPARGRIMMGGMGDSYLSFFKIENEVDTKHVKIAGELKKNDVSKQSIAEKDHIIHNLQEKIMKETVKKNARERCFQERVTTDWRTHLEHFLKRLTCICLAMSSSRDHRKHVLRALHQSCQHAPQTKKQVYAILAWILLWLQPILKLLHESIRRKYS